MKTLNVPTEKLSDLKAKPYDVFKRAKKENNGIYVFKNSEVAGVVLSKNNYESMVETIGYYENRIDELKALNRINNPSRKLFSDEEIRGAVTANAESVDFDEWE